MALPKLTTPTYELDLPSTGEKIKYRPFLVKEQKLLMMAEESKEEKQISQTIQQLIGTCTFGKVDAIVSPIFDVEYVFLQLRMRSVGANIELNITCPDDKKTQVPVKINLEDVNVQMDLNHSNKLNISDKIKMIMKYPVLGDVAKASGSESTQVFDILHQCVHEVHDGDTIYHRVDMSDSDLTEFVDSFTGSQFEMVTEFFETMPKLRHIVDITNPKTKVKSEVIIEGLESFLV